MKWPSNFDDYFPSLKRKKAYENRPILESEFMPDRIDASNYKKRLPLLKRR